jgi:gamma-tubulin complex component 2
LPRWLLTHTSFSDAPDAATTVSAPVSEAALLDDLLYLLVGVNGVFVRVVERRAVIVAASAVDASWRELVLRIAPLAVDVADLSALAAEFADYACGLVRHAFSAALKTLLSDFAALVAQLEARLRAPDSDLTLLSLGAHLAAPMRYMSRLSALARDARDWRGAALLNALHHAAGSAAGDRELAAVLTGVLEQTARPYLGMLHAWIYDGVLSDPYGEFLVTDSDGAKLQSGAAATPSAAAANEQSEQRWRRFALGVAGELPWFLERADADLVLVTGKYLITIRDSGGATRCDFAAPIEHRDHAAYYARIVRRAHAHASRLVLQTLRERAALVDRLDAACHYFLLRRGDAMTRLLALAEGEFAKRVGAASRVRLASMLGVALRDGAETSNAASLRFEDDVSCELLPYNLPQQLLRILRVSASGGVSLMDDALQLEAREAAVLGSASKKRAVEEAALRSPDGKSLTAERVAFDSDVLQAMSGLTSIEAFSLTFAVPWPASLVLSRDALCKYQLLFRHTFLCKHVERQLALAWSALNDAARAHRGLRDVSGVLLRASLVRQRMAHYVHELLYFVTAEVLEPNVRAWHAALAAATTVDDVLRDHGAFLDRCLHQCMLTDRNLVKLVMRMLTVSGGFADYVCQCASRAAGGMDDAQSVFSAEFDGSVQKAASQFDALFRLALEAFAAFSATQSHLTHFLARLDFNSFYAPNVGGAVD